MAIGCVFVFYDIIDCHLKYSLYLCINSNHKNLNMAETV